jgi:predicted transcriptional regulator
MRTATPFKSNGKDSKYFPDSKLIAVRKAFKERPKTMREVSKELNEERSNICYYVGMLRDAGHIEVHHRGECATTGLIVNYYTTNPELFREDNQLNIWKNDNE